MSQWANEHPEEMAEIAALPLNQQNAALRAAIGYDPDRVRDEYEERIHCHRDLSTSAGESLVVPPDGSGSDSPAVAPSTGEEPSRSSSPSPVVDLDRCDVCGAPVGKHHLSYCDLRGEV